MSNSQLFCFPYAGGTASFFDVIERDLVGIDVVKLEYAGHGNRHREELYNSFDELADDMYHLWRASNEDEKYALFGYSMGCISLVEVLKRIIDSGAQYPSHIFLAAHEPHTKSELLDFTADELDTWVKDRTIKFGGVPEKLLNNNAFWRMYLPLYRADYTMIGNYDFDGLRLKTDIPATIFYSETDTPLKEMKLWERYFAGWIDYHKYEGQHFFIQEYHKEMAKVISTQLGV